VLDELYAIARPLSDVIRANSDPGRREVDHLLYSSARHVAVAAWGRQLEAGWAAHDDELRAMFPGLDQATMITAAPTLVFVGATTSLDLCAAALGHWCGYVDQRGYECDMGTLARPPFTMPPWAVAWFDDTTMDPRWLILKDYRDAQAHRILPRSVTVGASTITSGTTVGDTAAPAVPPPPPAPSRQTFTPSGADRGPTVDDRHRYAIELAQERWKAFWTFLAAYA
jgi:hypothetical protein